MKTNYVKKLTKAMFIMTMAMGIALTGCKSDDDAGSSSKQEEKEITVTFMNGDETLGTVTAKSGNVLDAASYEQFEERDDAKLLGWYETPSFLEASKKDLTKDVFEEDTILYGSFQRTDITEDTRVWYIAGTSEKGILGANNWAGALEDEEKEQFKFTKDENSNTFTLTLDLYVGDQFQLIHDWDWDGQLGYGYFTDIDDTQMESGGSLEGSGEKANVNVIMDGNYTITLITDPDNPSTDTISVVRNSDVIG